MSEVNRYFMIPLLILSALIPLNWSDETHPRWMTVAQCTLVGIVLGMKIMVLLYANKNEKNMD